MREDKNNVNTYGIERPLSLNLNRSDCQLSSHMQLGKLYELALFIYTLINNITKVFDLGKEIKFGDKWDDLVVKQEENNYNLYTFLQIKLIDDSENSNNFIDSKVLLGKRRISLKDDDFNLKKYFISYLRIKDQLNSRDDKSKIKKLIIFSNALLDIEDLNKNVGDVLYLKSTSDIVPNTNKNYIDNSNISYKLTKVKETFVREMKSNLKSDVIKLAQELAHFVLNTGSETMSLDKDYLVYYHTSLIDEMVIEVFPQQHGNRTIKKAKFTENFQFDQNLTHRAQNLRHKLLHILKKKGMNSLELQKNIEFAEWTVSEDYDLRQTKDFIFLPNYDIEDKDIIEYFTILELRMKQYDTKEILNSIINVEIKKTFLEYYDTDPKLVEFLIHDFVLSWKSRTSMKEMWILNKERSKFIKDLKIKISKPKAVHKTKEHVKYLEKICNTYNLYYDDTCLFGKSYFNHNFIAIKTKSILLTSAKLIQSLNKLKRFDIIFMNLNNFLIQKEIIKLLDAFRSEDFGVMLISYTFAVNNSICEDIYAQISKIINEHSKKTIIFISSINDDSLIQKFAFQRGYKEYKDKKIGLQYLKNASKILDLNIYVQDQCLKLCDFLNKSQINSNLVNEKVIEDLISDREIRFGMRLNGISNLEGAYIDIVEDVNAHTLANKLLSENSNEIYLINGLTGSKQEEKIIDTLIAGVPEDIKNINFNDIKKYTEIIKQENLVKRINKHIQVCEFGLKEQSFKRICNKNPQKIIYWLSMIDNDTIPKFVLVKIYNPEFYITGKRFNDKIVINRNIKTLLVSSNISDLFIIVLKYKSEFENWLQLVNFEEKINFKKNCKNNTIRFVSCKDIGKTTFKKSIEYNSSQSIHLLHFEQNHLSWIKTHGLINKLIKFKKQNNEGTTALLDENMLIREIKDKKTVLFVGDPGIGKSTALIKLCESKYASKCSIENSMMQSHWLIIVNLKDHIQAIKNININTSDEVIIRKEIIKFLSQVDQSLNNDFAQTLLGVALVNDNFKKPVLILFDGFDEIIDSTDKNKVIFLLQEIKNKTTAKSWITSRLHCEYSLENAMSIFSIKLEKMGDDHVHNYITQYLRNRLSLILNPDKFESLFGKTDNININAKIRQFTNAFSSRVQKVFPGDKSEFIGTPLQLYLMLEDLARQFIKSVLNDVVFNPDFSNLGTDIWSVYEKFIEKKYVIYFKKVNVSEQLKRDQDQVIFDHYHRNLAKSLMFNSIAKKDLVHFKDILLRVGIIRLHCSNMEFIHPTFKEYFAAKETISWINKWNKKLKNTFTNFSKQEYLLGQILIKPEYKMVRIFLNEKFWKESFENIQLQEIYYDNDILHVGVREGLIGIVNFVLCNAEGANINAFSLHPLLHEATERGNLKMIQFLIENNAHINSKDYFYYDESVLQKAARLGSIDMVKILVEYGANVNDKDKNSISVLQRAIKSKNIKVVKFLINNGANINATDDNGRSVLYWAVNCNNLEIVRILIEEGANVNSHTKSGNSVLNCAVIHCDLQMVKLLVASDLNIYSRNNNNQSVLHTAAEYDKLEIIKFLISQNLDVNTKDNYDKSVLHYAIESSNFEMVSLLVENGANVNARDKKDNSVLHYAARSNNLRIVQFLLAKGGNANVKNNRNISVLNMATESGSFEMVQFLMSLGINIHTENDINQSILHSAARSGKLELVKLFVDKGINVNKTDIFRKSALHIAAEIKKIDMVKFLVQEGANVNAIDSNGMSVLHSAAKMNSFDIMFILSKKYLGTEFKEKSYESYLHDANEIVKYLVSCGANINTKNFQGKSAIQSAAESNNFELVKLMIKLGAHVDSKNIYNKLIYLSSTFFNLDMFKFIIDCGLDVDSKDSEGKSAFHKAAESQSLELMKYLVKSGADINMQDQNGKSVLHYNFLSFDMVKFLVEVGADVKVKDVYNRSILHYAVESGNLDIVKFLTEAGVDVNSKDKDGVSILHIATKTRYMAMIKYLVRSGADVNASDNYDKSVVHFASEKGDLDIVKFLMNRHANIFARTKSNISILHYAVKSGNLELVQYLYDKGLHIDLNYNIDKFIVHDATESGNLELVKFLLSKGACIFIQDCGGKTILHKAAENFNFAMIEFLIGAGLDTNAQDREEKTILHYAVFSSNVDLVKCILEAGADVNIQDINRKSILHCAVETCNLELVKLIVQKGGNVNALDKDHKSVIHNAAKYGGLDIVEYLIMCNADASVKDLYNKSVLHYAVESDNIDMVKCLLAKGLDINSKDINGKSVLKTAFEVDTSTDLLKYLIIKGADVNSSDKYGVTILHNAAYSGNLDIVEFVVANGGDINAKDNNGKTVLQYGEESGDLRVIKFLLREENADWKTWLQSS